MMRAVMALPGNIADIKAKRLELSV